MTNDKKMIAKEALQALAEIEAVTEMKDLIKNNIIEFIIEEKTYRVRKPSFVEREDISNANRQKYLFLVKDDTYLFRKQWIEKYKNKGININEMENNIDDGINDIGAD